MGEWRELWVPGDPVPQPRPAVVTFGPPCPACKRRPHTRVAPGKGRAGAAITGWKEAISTVARATVPGGPVDGPLEMTIIAILSPPPSLLRKDGTLRKGARVCPTGARDGDVDNLAKAVLDALHGIVYEDDAAVVKLTVSKVWNQDSGVYVGWRES